MTIWTVICILPIGFLLILLLGVGLILAKEEIEIAFVNYLKKHGKKTKGVIISSEQYRGDGLHDSDPCFKGEYEFEDERGKKIRGRFSRYCYEPYDFAYSKYTFNDVKNYYRVGNDIVVYYLGWLPFLHIPTFRSQEVSGK